MGRKRIYDVDQNSFNKIENQDQAYWLGFMYADGYIIQNKYNSKIIGIKMALSDHLEKFKKFLNSSHPIKSYISNNGFNKNKKFYTFNIVSEILFNDLNKLGCVPRKSSILKFPTENIVPISLISHFCRGYFDGDGSIGIAKIKNGWEYPAINIVGTFDFISSYSSLLQIRGRIIYKDNRNSTYSIKTNSKIRGKIIYNFLYKNALTYMPEKKIKFEYFNLDK